MHPLLCEFLLIFAPAHPELIHLDEELSKRRDKRLELAPRCRTYEVSDAANRKRGLELVEGIPVARTSGFGIDTFFSTSATNFKLVSSQR